MIYIFKHSGSSHNIKGNAFPYLPFTTPKKITQISSVFNYPAILSERHHYAISFPVAVSNYPFAIPKKEEHFALLS